MVCFASSCLSGEVEEVIFLFRDYSWRLLVQMREAYGFNRCADVGLSKVRVRVA